MSTIAPNPMPELAPLLKRLRLSGSSTRSRLATVRPSPTRSPIPTSSPCSSPTKSPGASTRSSTCASAARGPLLQDDRAVRLRLQCRHQPNPHHRAGHLPLRRRESRGPHRWTLRHRKVPHRTSPRPRRRARRLRCAVHHPESVAGKPQCRARHQRLRATLPHLCSRAAARHRRLRSETPTSASGRGLPRPRCRALRTGATIISSNLDFPEWGDAFPNRLLGAATLDRLRHGAYR